MKRTQEGIDLNTSIDKEREEIGIIPHNNGVEVVFNNLDLNAEHPTTPSVEVTFEKQPITMLEGKSYVGWSVLIDKENEAMDVLASQAEALKDLPEIERVRAVMKLLRESVHYAYNDVVEALSKTDAELAKWVSENTGLNSDMVLKVPLSKIIENKYGVCRHLAVANLWLANKAGLSGVILCSKPGKLTNIVRTDSNEKLFKSADVGAPVSGHSWIEIKTSEGKWIPVDPSTQLVGDTEENLEMFKQANYKAIGYGVDAFSSQPELSVEQTEIEFESGEATAQGKFWMQLKSIKPTRRWASDKMEEMPPTNTPYKGEGKILLKTGGEDFGIALKIENVESAQ